jgi:hypothetical protein
MWLLSLHKGSSTLTREPLTLTASSSTFPAWPKHSVQQTQRMSMLTHTCCYSVKGCYNINSAVPHVPSRMGQGETSISIKRNAPITCSTCDCSQSLQATQPILHAAAVWCHHKHVLHAPRRYCLTNTPCKLPSQPQVRCTQPSLNTTPFIPTTQSDIVEPQRAPAVDRLPRRLRIQFPTLILTLHLKILLPRSCS